MRGHHLLLRGERRSRLVLTGPVAGGRRPLRLRGERGRIELVAPLRHVALTYNGCRLVLRTSDAGEPLLLLLLPLLDAMRSLG